VAVQRPILRQSGGLYYLEWDTVDDWLGTSVAPAFTAAMDVVMSNQRLAGVSVAPITVAPSDGHVIAVGVSGDVTPAANLAGTPSNAIDGVAVPGGTGATRAAMYTAWPQATDCVLEVIGADLSAWSAFGFGDYAPPFAGLQRTYGLIARQTLSAGELANVRTYLAAKAGRVL
jgi:hypothetical protein